MAGFATRASFAGHPSRSATAGHALTFTPDHLMGAGQSSRQERTAAPTKRKVLAVQCPRNDKSGDHKKYIDAEITIKTQIPDPSVLQ